MKKVDFQQDLSNLKQKLGGLLIYVRLDGKMPFSDADNPCL